MHKILWDFEIQTDLLISARRQDLVIVNKKKRKKKKKKWTSQIVDFAFLADHRIKLIEREKRQTYLNLAREPKKAMQHEGDSDTNCSGCARNNLQRIRKKTGKLRNE